MPYEQAAKVLFGMGHASDAREILLEKERLQTADEQTPLLRQIGRELWDAFAGYGYRSRRTLSWMAGFVFLGAIFFSIAESCNQIAPHQPAIMASEKYQNALTLKGSTPIKAVRKAFPVEYPEFNPLVFSLDVFIPLFALHQEPFWTPVSGWDGNLFMRAFVLLPFFLLVLLLLVWALQRMHLLVFLAGVLVFIISAIIFWDYLPDAWAQLLEVEMFTWLLADGYWFTLWYWIEIAAGWLLTSLLLLSGTGLLRPRQSSGEKS